MISHEGLWCSPVEPAIYFAIGVSLISIWTRRKTFGTDPANARINLANAVAPVALWIASPDGSCTLGKISLLIFGSRHMLTALAIFTLVLCSAMRLSVLVWCYRGVDGSNLFMSRHVVVPALAAAAVMIAAIPLSRRSSNAYQNIFDAPASTSLRVAFCAFFGIGTYIAFLTGRFLIPAIGDRRSVRALIGYLACVWLVAVWTVALVDELKTGHTLLAHGADVWWCFAAGVAVCSATSAWQWHGFGRWYVREEYEAILRCPR